MRTVKLSSLMDLKIETKLRLLFIQTERPTTANFLVGQLYALLSLKLLLGLEHVCTSQLISFLIHFLHVYALQGHDRLLLLLILKHKCLGMIFSHELNFSKHINYIKFNVILRLKILYKLN